MSRDRDLCGGGAITPLMVDKPISEWARSTAIPRADTDKPPTK